MVAQPESYPHMTEAEYLAFERAHEFKHEFIDGKVYEAHDVNMTHILISVSAMVTIHTQLYERPCLVLASRMRTRAPGAYFYPDIVVVCDDVQVEDAEEDTLLNPTLIIEVLSPSTEAYDRGLKFQRYREIKSLKEYVLIAQDKPHIEHFVRQKDGLWQFSDVDGLETTLPLPSIDCTLALAEVYEQVDFTPDGTRI